MNYQPVTALNDLPERQPVKVNVADTDIVLIRDGEKVRAFQATCPHAGAPLEQGAVCDDKLVCPWHKAVFSLEEGHMCEPLALADLKQYPLRVENGIVQVNPKAMSSATPIGSGADAPVYAVLGGGAAGSAAVWTLRRDGFKGKIVLVERESDAPYDRTALTKFVPSGKMDISEVPRILKEDILQHVDRVQGEVTRLDTREQRLHFADGASLFYDKLLIASGGAPQRPELPGSDLAGVHLLRSRHQADELLKEVDKSQQLVIIGNSFIGMEMASALRDRDVEVTVVARHPLPFAQQFGEQIGHYFRDLHRGNGVQFVDGDPAALEGEHHVTALRMQDGQRIKADVVLLATGIKPATGFIHDLPLREDGSLLADSQLRVTENVWVAGDIASYLTPQGPLRVEHYRVAHQQGRIAAFNMLDKRMVYDRVPFFWTTHFGTRYEYLGHAEKWDEYRLIGSLEEKNFIALYGQQGKLAAIFSCGKYTLTASLTEEMQQPMTMEQALARVESSQA
ncbi:FAD-dependent oxidoreductase [Pantoea sp. KPR_PJ]|uniref:FAD-dependent oxidoreductase n=1 Tax=Pantoea sp. KPR_PJ TaxID=2738375 RepID=UPI0035286698